MKVCRKCNISKADSEFRKCVQNKDGLRSYCRECDKKISEEWRRKQGIPVKQKKITYELPREKTCSRCNNVKAKTEFRVRWEKRQVPPFPYLNNTCKKCDAEIALENHYKNRRTPEGRKRNQESAKKAYKKRRDKAVEHMKKKRSTPEYKKMMRDYRQRNREKIQQQEIITKRRYHEKNRDAVTDAYVINNLRQKGIIEPSVEQMEMQRVKILTKRLKRKIHERHSEFKKSSV